MTPRGFAVAVLLSCLAVPVLAQDTPRPGDHPAPPPVERKGFLIGFSIGSGFSSRYRASFDLHVGGMARPDLAVFIETYGVEKSSDRLHSIIAAGAQYWLNDRVWVKGGIGYGQADSDDGLEDSQGRLGGLAGVGFEVVRSGRFTLDLQLRGLATAGGGGATGSFNIGLNWY